MTKPRPSTPSTRSKTGGPGPKRRAALAKKGDLRHVRAEERQAKGEIHPSGTLSGKAARYLRGLGHHLEPVVQIGKDGITEGVVTATRAALLAHELIKVRILSESPVDRKEAGAELAARAGAALAQTLGRTLLLYKRHPNKPKIVLPRA